MFINIDTKNATNILISVPSDKAEKALPAIINMLEKNAVFIKDEWNEIKKVEPSSTITLGECYNGRNYNNEVEFKVEPNDHVIEGFEPINNELFISFTKFKEEKEEQIKKLKLEIEELKEKNASQSKKIEAFISCDEADVD